MSTRAVVSEELAKKFATEKETRPTPAGCAPRGSTSSAGHVRPRSAHGGAQAVGAARRECGVFLNHDASRTSNDCYVCEIPAGGKLAPQRQLFEEMILVLDGQRLDHGLERRRPEGHLRVEGRRALRHPAQRLAPALQRLGPEAGALRRRSTNAPPVINLFDDIDFVFNTRVRLQEPLQRRAGLLSPTRASSRACCSRPTSSPTRSTCR